MSTFTKIVRVVLFLQVALALFVGVAYWMGLPGFSDGDTESRKVTAFVWGFAVLLFFAGWRVPQEPRWIYPVLAVVLLNWLESSYELFVLGDRAFIPPLVIESILGTIYATYAISVAKTRQV